MNKTASLYVKSELLMLGYLADSNMQTVETA